VSGLKESRNKRYSRQLLLKEIGEEGQRKLLEARVIVVGAGGLGSPILTYLAAAGIGTIGIVDSDNVDESNLQRQIIHWTPDVGRPKVVSAKEKMEKINPDVCVITHDEMISPLNVEDILSGYDIVIDACDNYGTRYVVNDACVLHGKPFIYGSVYQFEGQASVFAGEGWPCYRCVFPVPPEKDVRPSAGELGLIGSVPGIIGLIQVSECIKIITGAGDLLKGRLLVADILRMNFREFRIQKNGMCRVCGEKPEIKAINKDESTYWD